MKMHSRLLLILLLIISGLPVCAQSPTPVTGPFQIGADLSLAKAIIDKGGIYYVDNKPVDLFQTLIEDKFGYARLRLFHTPDGRSSYGTVNSLSYTIALAKLVKAAGMKLLLDFHYSDTWADPGHQTKPAAWNSFNFNALNDSIYDYTKKTLNAFADNGIYPDMVQTGNEISNGMLWPDGASWNGNKPNYRNFATLLKSAIRGVRESSGGGAIPVMLHAATGGSLTDSRIFIDSLSKYNVPFDVIGLSYYIVWHGVMSGLESNLAYLSSTYSQDIIIAETSYQADGTVPSGSVVTQGQLPYPFTVQGQYDYLQALYTLARKYPKVKGIYYWGGEYIWAGDIGGSWSALFNWDGKARKALTAFRDMTSGTLPSPLASQHFTVYQYARNQIGIRSDFDISNDTQLTIYDLQGRVMYRKPITGTHTTLDFKPTVSGIFVAVVSDNGNILYREKIMLDR